MAKGEEPGVGTDRPARVGRKRDTTLDGRILDATIEVLAEAGYDGLTMDAVASRAGSGKAALYRRWSSKEEMVIGAVTRMKRDQVDMDRLPDTGTLRGDLLGLLKPQSVEEREYRLKVMSGLASMLNQHRSLAEAGSAAIVEPWIEAYRVLIGRAVERGEVAASADVEMASQVIPAMVDHRTMIRRKPFDPDFVVALIDGILLPALGIDPNERKEKR